MELEMVKFTEHGQRGAVTMQLALNGVLAHPFTMNKAEFLGFPDGKERDEFLKRSARTLIDVYGDARDGRRLSDSEVQERTTH